MIVALANQKGGTGKTTVAANLALATAAVKRRTALIDADVQGTTATFFGESEYLNIYRAGEDVGTITRNLDEEFIFIDSPPSVSTIPKLIMGVADLVVIPTQPSPFDIAASSGTVDIYNAMIESQGWAPVCYFLLNRVKPGTTFGKESAEYIRKTYELPVLETRLHDYELYKQAPLAGKSVMEYSKTTRQLAKWPAWLLK